MLAVVADLLFVPILFGVILAYRRQPGAVQRDVLLIFMTLAVFFLRDLIRRTSGTLPEVPNDVLSVIQFAQGALTLWLLSRLRHVPVLLMRLVAASYLASVVLLFTFHSPLPLGPLIYIIGSTAAAGLLACVMLILDTVRRTGAARVRLALAAAATATFAAALVVGSLGGISSHLTDASRTWARVIGLVAALCYAAAFVPPAWLRRLWAATATYQVSQQLLRSETTSSGQTWQRYAEILREVRDVDAAIVLLDSDDGLVEVASAGVSLDPVSVYDPDDLAALLAQRQPIRALGTDDLASRFAKRVRIGLTYVTVAPVRVPPDTYGALVLLSRYRSLFIDDDLSLLTDLGTQAGIIAERGEMLATHMQLAQRLAASVEALTAANQAKTDFLTNMSHELRTPLNAIIGFSDLMRHEVTSAEGTLVPTEWIDHINGGGKHLLELINDMLDLAKVEAGRMELRLEPVNLATVVGSAVSRLRPLMLRKELRLIENVAPVFVTADHVRLRQILDNLVANAIKFTPSGGTIGVDAERDGEFIAVSVTDSGIGIAPEDHARVFEEFQQVGDPTAAVAGTGLGLALTRRLVEAHGGTIGVSSQLGAGARFTVRLPAAPTPVTQPESPRPPDPLDTAPAGRDTILIIEDEPGAVRLLRTYLEAAGYTVRAASDGASGLAMARHVTPTAIVLDVILPGLDGWEVLRQLKLDPSTRDVPVVMVTVVDEQEIGLALGAVDYLVKPIDRQVLLNVLARHSLIGPAMPSGAPIAALAIDDDPTSLAIVSTCLEQEGIGVSTADNGADGLRIARSHRFDVIVCDLLMPDIDGFTVIAELQEDPKTRSVPILVVTAQDLTAADKLRLNGNILGIVQKGAALEEGMRRWLGRLERAAIVVEGAP